MSGKMEITLQLKRQEEPAPVELLGRKMPVNTSDKLNRKYNTRKAE
jgi:hypothetical protein